MNLNWNNVDSVFLDMDGTLLDLHFDDHFWQEFLPKRYAQARGISDEHAQQELVPKFKTQEGKLNWYCIDYWSRQLNMDIVELKREVSYLIDVHDGVIDFLNAMRQLKKRVVLVTNAHRKTLDLKMERTQLDVHFDNIVVSHDLGLAKENKGFWERLQNVEPFNPMKTLFIDDSIPVLRNAAHYGVKYLFAVSKPSSQRPSRQIDEFECLESFRRIIPTI